MNLRSVFFLLFILIALVLYLVFFEKNMKSTDEKKAVYNKVFLFEPETINKIFLRTKNNRFKIKKSNNLWFLEYPVNARADINEIKSILNELNFLEFKRQVNADKSEIKLAEPLYELDFFSDKKKYSLALGSTTSLGSNIYILTRGSGNGTEKIYTVDSMIKNALNKDLYDLRSKMILPDTISSPNKIVIRRDNLDITLFKDTKTDNWRIVTPVKRLADQKRINEIIISFRNLKILDFIKDNAIGDLSEYGLVDPFLTVSFYDKDLKQTVNFGRFFSNESRCFAMNNTEKNVYSVESNAARIFLSSLFELSTKKIFDLKQTDFNSFKISYMKNDFLIRNINKPLILSKPLGILIDKSEVKKFFKLLNLFEIQEYIIDNSEKENIKSNFLPYSVKLFYNDKSKSALDYVFYFSPQRFYVSDVSKNLFWRVKPVPTADIPFDVLSFAKKDIIPISRYTLDVLEFNTPSVKGVFTERNGIWHLNESILLPEESEPILNAIEKIKVKQIYAVEKKNIKADLHLDSPEMYFEFKFKDNTKGNIKNFRLLIGKKSSGLLYAQKEGYPLIFTIESKYIKSLVSKISKYSNIKSSKD